MIVLLKYLFSLFLILNPCLTSSCDCKFVVELEQGKLGGKKSLDKNNGIFYSFMSIPYAKPPLGKLRFKAPENPEPWTGTRDATIDFPHCPQTSSAAKIEDSQQSGQEDCLYLNVYSPKVKLEENENLQPVMVFIHGGGYFEGSASRDLYGPEFLMPTGVVLVTTNYRLGILGFASSKDDMVGIPGNAGLKDQTMALKWVKRNIRKFGGDPDNVTIFGESAGGASVHFHMLSPMSKGLFHRVIAMSGTANNAWNRGVKGSLELKAKQLNVSTDDTIKMLEIMQALSVKEILDVQGLPDGLIIPIHVPFAYSPVVETQTNSEVFLPALPKDIINSGIYNKVPIIVGYTDIDGIMMEVTNRLYYGKPKIYKDLSLAIPSDLKLTPNEKVVVTNKMKLFYFGGEESSESNLRNLTDLSTDIYSTAGISNMIKGHLRNDDIVYLYRFSADTELNFFKKKHPVTALIPGACHVDDLGYVFKSRITPLFEKDSVEDKTIDMVVGLWSNFAKHGTPTISESKVNWLPVTKDKINYLEIGTTLATGVGPDKLRFDFWNDIYSIYGNNV